MDDDLLAQDSLTSDGVIVGDDDTDDAEETEDTLETVPEEEGPGEW